MYINAQALGSFVVVQSPVTGENVAVQKNFVTMGQFKTFSEGIVPDNNESMIRSGRFIYNPNGTVARLMWSKTGKVGEVSLEAGQILSHVHTFVCGADSYQRRLKQSEDGAMALYQPDSPAVLISWIEAQAFAFSMGGRLPFVEEYRQIAKTGNVAKVCEGACREWMQDIFQPEDTGMRVNGTPAQKEMPLFGFDGYRRVQFGGSACFDAHEGMPLGSSHDGHPYDESKNVGFRIVLPVEAVHPNDLVDPAEIDDGGDLNLMEATRRLEAEFIRKALIRMKGNRSETAKILKISHRALLYKMKDYGLTDL